MSFEQMESARRDATETILSRFGASLAKAEQLASGKTSDPWLKKVTAARMALEYAVLATAREKGAATEVVAGALKGASIEQQAAMIKEGAAAMGRAYRVEPEVLVNVFAGKIADVTMPKGLGSTPEIDKMVDTCRSLVTSIVQQEYASRGKFTAGSYDKDSFIALKSDGVVSPVKSELAARVAFMESAIDSASKAGAITESNAGMLKERIEAQVFQPRPPQSLKFSKEFTAFFENRGKGIRIEAMKEVRGITQSQTVQDIGAKLKLVMPARVPADHRTQSGLER
jgi:hypothetical protein